jgi:hypothetical protein
MISFFFHKIEEFNLSIIQLKHIHTAFNFNFYQYTDTQTTIHSENDKLFPLIVDRVHKNPSVLVNKRLFNNFSSSYIFFCCSGNHESNLVFYTRITFQVLFNLHSEYSCFFLHFLNFYNLRGLSKGMRMRWKKGVKCIFIISHEKKIHKENLL